MNWSLHGWLETSTVYIISRVVVVMLAVSGFRGAEGKRGVKWGGWKSCYSKGAGGGGYEKTITLM